MKAVLDLAEKIRSIEAESGLKSAVEDLANLIDFEYFLFGLSISETVTTSSVLIKDNYPLAWRAHYDDARYIAIDPIVLHSRDKYSPVVWEYLETENWLKKEHKVVLSECKNYCLNTGFSIPLHVGAGEFGMLSFASEDTSESQKLRISDAIPVAQIIAPILQDAIKRVEQNAQKNNRPQLTKREIESLTWAMEGKSAWEIARIIGCTERTANFHLANSVEKLGAVNRYQAISKALLLGIIKPSFSSANKL